MRCKICGTEQKNDLFSFVTSSPCCTVCTINFFGGYKQTAERIADVRSQLGLTDGEYLKQDNFAEAKRILGRD